MNSDNVDIADIHGSSPSSRASLAEIYPSDEELKIEITELLAVAPEAGTKTLRKLIKEKHPHWKVTETRMRKAFTATKKTARTEVSI
jgi:hypothetical protein